MLKIHDIRKCNILHKCIEAPRKFIGICIYIHYSLDKFSEKKVQKSLELI